MKSLQKLNYKVGRALSSSLILLAAAHGYGAQDPSTWGQVPENWYQLPEETPLILSKQVEDTSRTEKNLGTVVQRVFNSNANALDSIPFATNDFSAKTGSSKDLVPWHLTMLTSELAITFQGLLGVLTIKGTPTVQAIWRRKTQIPLSSLTSEESQISDESYLPARDLPILYLNDEQTEDDIQNQIEPIIQAAISTGRVKNTDSLRKKLAQTSREFQSLIEVLMHQTRSSWWVSGYRFDFLIDGSGNLKPVGTLGGELRLRLEWKRLNQRQPGRVHRFKDSPQITQKMGRTRDSLESFVRFAEEVLEEAADSNLVDSGFRAYAFRVGIGISTQGTIGIAKGSASMLGHLNFSRDITVPKPVSPLSTEGPFPKPGGFSGVSEGESQKPIFIIENKPKASHLTYAQAIGIPFKLNASTEEEEVQQAIYTVEREKLKKGLQKAMKIGGFFAKQSAHSKSRKWGLYDLRTAFDISITGDLGLAAIGGLATTEIYFRNQRF